MLAYFGVRRVAFRCNLQKRGVGPVFVCRQQKQTPKLRFHLLSKYWQILACKLLFTYKCIVWFYQCTLLHCLKLFLKYVTQPVFTFIAIQIARRFQHPVA